MKYEFHIGLNVKKVIEAPNPEEAERKLLGMEVSELCEDSDPEIQGWHILGVS